MMTAGELCMRLIWCCLSGTFSTYVIILIIVFLLTEAKIFEEDKLYGEERFEI